MITLHGVTASPFVRKVVLCLEIKGLAYEQVDVFPKAMPEAFKALSPLMKIPAFEDGDLKLCDSAVICEYLHEKYPGTSLMPNTIEERAKARWFESYADSTLVNLASGIFFERMLKPLLGGETDEARVEKIIQVLLPKQYEYLETVIPEQGFLFGAELMMADIALATHFLNAGYAGYSIDENLAPKLHAYVERFKALPIIVKRMEADNAFFDA
ncbi:MAG: glutathione S-transferase family protein, partial [Sinobacterium sp.]|nr:glutathione S-transferase family protein [Sinobacterium sp.]